MTVQVSGVWVKTATKPIPANNPMGKGTTNDTLPKVAPQQKIEESPLHL
jgi:hypothetical protein